MPDGLPAAPPGPSGEDWRAGGFGLYVHWPFCAAKCPYCDFNSHVRRGIDQHRWRAALVAGVRRSADTVPGRVLNSVFFGGGTPTLLDPADLVAAVEGIRSRFGLAEDAEVTTEANPDSVTPESLATLAAGGFTRNGCPPSAAPGSATATASSIPAPSAG